MYNCSRQGTNQCSNSYASNRNANQCVCSVVVKATARPAKITPKETAAKACKNSPLLFFMLSIDVFMRSKKLTFGFV